MLNLRKQVLDSIVSFSRSYKMFDIRIFFSYLNIMYFFLLVSLTTNDINKCIRNGIFNLMVIISDFLESFRFADIINYYTSIWPFIVMGNNGSINLLTTSVIIIIPCFLTLFYVEVDRKCRYSSVIIEIVLIPGKKCSFSCGSKTKNDDFILRYVLTFLTVERTFVH